VNADRDKLQEVRAKLEKCLELLPQTGAPAGIADHLEMGLRRLDAFLKMIDKWDDGSSN
jgi:hypothetical protein